MSKWLFWFCLKVLVFCLVHEDWTFYALFCCAWVACKWAGGKYFWKIIVQRLVFHWFKIQFSFVQECSNFFGSFLGHLSSTLCLFWCAHLFHYEKWYRSLPSSALFCLNKACRKKAYKPYFQKHNISKASFRLLLFFAHQTQYFDLEAHHSIHLGCVSGSLHLI